MAPFLIACDSNIQGCLSKASSLLGFVSYFKLLQDLIEPLFSDWNFPGSVSVKVTFKLWVETLQKRQRVEEQLL